MCQKLKEKKCRNKSKRKRKRSNGSTKDCCRRSGWTVANLTKLTLVGGTVTRHNGCQTCFHSVVAPLCHCCNVCLSLILVWQPLQDCFNFTEQLKERRKVHYVACNAFCSAICTMRTLGFNFIYNVVPRLSAFQDHYL